MTERVSITSGGVESNGLSRHIDISADGRYVVFHSEADNLVTGDTNFRDDIFVHDRTTNVTTRISVSGTGVQGNQDSRDPAISPDGRYIAFESRATNFASGDTNNEDIFVFDRITGALTRVSVDVGTAGKTGGENPDISTDGLFVAFQAGNLAPGFNSAQVYVNGAGATTRVSVNNSGDIGNGVSQNASISADGRFVAFQSTSSNLVTGDTNGSEDIFVHDRSTGKTERISVSSTGAQGDSWSKTPSISADGRYVAYLSSATNLVNGDTNSEWDIFVYDRQTGTTERVSVSGTGTEANRSSSESPSISSDGRYVSFESQASNLVDDDAGTAEDIFVHDRQTHLTVRVSEDSAGGQGSGSAPNFNGLGGPAISDNGVVAFASEYTNLVTGDTNNIEDVFVNTFSFSAPRFTEGNDTVTLNNSGETVDALGGNDSVTGGTGDDIINGGAGADILAGGDGNDTLDGGSTDTAEIDVLYGGVGNDTYIVNSIDSALDIVFEGTGFPGGATDVDTVISKGVFWWDFFNVAEVLTIDATAASGAAMISGKTDSIMNGNDTTNFLLTYGGSNEINPGRGVDVIGLGLLGLDASFNGVNTIKLKPGDDVNYIYGFESLTDKLDVSAYSRFANSAEMLANVATTSWGSLIWMGVEEGENEYVGIVGLNNTDLDASDFLVN